MIRSIFHTATSSVFLTLVSLITGVVLARALGSDGRGYLAVITVTAALASGLSQFGLGTSFVYTARNFLNWATNKVIILSILIVCTTSLIVGYAVYSNLQSESVSSVVIFVLLYVGVYSSQAFVFSALQLRDSLVAYNSIRNIPALVTLLVILMLWIAGRLDVIYSLIALFIGSLVGTCIGLYYLMAGIKKIPSNSLLVNNKGATIKYIEYGIKYHSTIILGILIQNLDKVLLSNLGGVNELGVYIVAYNASRIISPVLDAVATNIFAKHSGKQTLNLAGVTSVAFKFTFFPLLILCFILSLIIPFLLPLMYGAEFKPAVFPCIILLFECVIGGAGWMLAQRFAADGKPGFIFIRQFISMLPLLVFLKYDFESDITIYLALALLLSAIIRLILTIAAYPILLKEKAPSPILGYKDLLLIYDAISEKVKKRDRKFRKN